MLTPSAHVYIASLLVFLQLALYTLGIFFPGVDEPWKAFSYWTFVSFIPVLLVGVSVYLVKFRPIQWMDKKSKFDYALGCVFLVLGFVVVYLGAELRLDHMFAHSLSTDESYRAFGLIKQPFNSAMAQHHPPSDYYISAMLLKTFGFSEPILRSHAMVFSILFLVMSLLVCDALKISPVLGVVPAMVFAANPWLVRYAENSRSVSIGLFSIMATMYLLIAFYRITPRKWEFVLLTAGFYLFLNSIGLQPIVMLFSLFLVTGFLYFANKKLKKHHGCSLLAMIFGGLWFLPIVIDQFFFAQKYHRYMEFTDKSTLENAYGGMNLISEIEFINGLSMFPEVTKWLLVAGIGLAIVKMVWSKSRQYGVFLLGSIAGLLISCVVYIFIYNFVLVKNPEPRHFLFAVPMIIVVSNAIVWGVFDSRWLKKWKPVSLFLQFAFTCTAGFYSYGEGKSFDIYHFGRPDSGFRQAYNHMKKYSEKRAWTQFLTLEEPKYFAPIGMMLTEFYYDTSELPNLDLDPYDPADFYSGGSQSHYFIENFYRKQPEQIHFQFINGASIAQVEAGSWDFVELTSVMSVLTLEGTSKVDLLKTVVKYFEELNKKHPDTLQFYLVHEMLAYTYFELGDIESSDRHEKILFRLYKSSEGRNEEYLLRLLGRLKKHKLGEG